MPEAARPQSPPARPTRADEPNPSVEASGDAAPQLALEIGAVCECTGLSARTVRYYEEVGLLGGVRRRSEQPGARRVYGADDLERLRFIQRLKALGLSLAEIKELNTIHAIGGSTAAMLERLDGQLAGRLSELDDRIAELQQLRGEMSRYREHVYGRRKKLAEESR